MFQTLIFTKGRHLFFLYEKTCRFTKQKDGFSEKTWDFLILSK